MSRTKSHFSVTLFLVAILLTACGDSNDPRDSDLVKQPEKIDFRKARNIEESLRYSLQNSGRINDTVRLRLDTLVYQIYSEARFQANWSREEHFLPLADSMLVFIERSKEYGLFPSDYHNRALHQAMNLLRNDSISRMDAALWSRADLMLTDALLLVSRHLKQGRLEYDSVTLRTDTVLPLSFYRNIWTQTHQSQQLLNNIHPLEPAHPAYDSLKTALKFWLDSIPPFRRLTQLIYPNKDTAALRQQLQRRLFEADLLPSPVAPVDTANWRLAISTYQKEHGLKVTGRINENTAKSLNNTDWEKFKRIAVTLDRYKHLPDTMPQRYVWVNIPSFYMRLMENDSVRFLSRIVVGKPNTRTPLLTSKITDMITYPQWTIPVSIIVKEILPGVKKNPDYFEEKGYSLIDKNGNEVDPHTVDWKKYTKGIPYKVVQGSGDANALGILKFNFSNKYAVYLHDTNQRYLFSNAFRSLSHGCVRVQEWQKLAYFLIRNDSLNRKPNTSFIGSDTLRAWLKRKEKHYLPVRDRLPVFIRYFSCEGINGKIRFYEDIYGEDKSLREKYFADKSIQ